MTSNIVLVIPENNIDASPLVYPPLGLLYIAAVLESEGHNVLIHDMRESQNTIENIPEAQFYGFTAVTAQANHLIKYSKYLRKHTNSFLFVGGPHASWFSDDLVEHFDAVFIGEAEEPVPQIIACRMKGIFRGTSLCPVDSIPFPSRHLMGDSKIVSDELWAGYRYGAGAKATTLITSRGCPWKCTFCANIPQKVRFRSLENIVEEIEFIIDRYGCKNFRFIDDNFIANKKRLKDMPKYFKELGISFRCAGRSDLLTDEVCECLVESGCKEIGFGIESADDDILSLLNKKETVEDHRKAIGVAKKHGLRTKAFFMAGLPGETWETIELNKKFVQEVQPDKIIVTLFTPYPGCAIWNNPEKFGIKIKEIDWDEYFQTYPSKSIIESDLASSEELTSHFEEFHKFHRGLLK